MKGPGGRKDGNESRKMVGETNGEGSKGSRADGDRSERAREVMENDRHRSRRWDVRKHGQLHIRAQWGTKAEWDYITR